MKSDGGVTSAATCVRQPVQTVLSGPAAGVVGAVVGRALGRLRRHHLDRRGRHQRRHLPGARRAARGHQGRHDRAVPAQAAHRRHPHDRRGRRQHRRGDQRGPPHGGAAQRGRRARARVLSARRRASRPSPTRTSCSGRIPAALLGGELPLDVAAAREAIAARIGAPAEPRRGGGGGRHRRDRRQHHGPRASAPSRWAAATTRAGSRWWPSAGRGRSTPAGWPSCSTSRP